jgi:hypothetical protein
MNAEQEIYKDKVRRYVNPYSPEARILLRDRLSRLASIRKTADRFIGTRDIRKKAYEESIV